MKGPLRIGMSRSKASRLGMIANATDVQLEETHEVATRVLNQDPPRARGIRPWCIDVLREIEAEQAKRKDNT